MKTVIGCEEPAPADGSWIDFAHCMECPKCKYLHFNSDTRHGEYQYTDYVTTTRFLRGMLWCDRCDGRFVLDDYTDSYELTREEVILAYPAFPAAEFNYFYEVTFAKILKVVDNTLVCYESKVPLPVADIAEILAANILELEKTLEKFSVTAPGSDMCEETQYNLALPCNTYDVFHPDTDYPKGMELDHGGCLIRLLCYSEVAGVEYDYEMWGD